MVRGYRYFSGGRIKKTLNTARNDLNKLNLIDKIVPGQTKWKRKIHVVNTN